MKNQKGFTLIELMVTMIIMVMLAIGASYTYSKYAEKAKSMKYISAASVATIDLTEYYLLNGSFSGFSYDNDYIETVSSTNKTVILKSKGINLKFKLKLNNQDYIETTCLGDSKYTSLCK